MTRWRAIDQERIVTAEKPVVTVLHRGRRYVVRFLKCTEDRFAVVCFEYWKPQPSLDGEFAPEGFFRDRRINAVGVLAAENDWFQHAEMDAVLAAIRGALAGYTLVGYGGSMGAYACINFADRLGLRRVIAVSPQFSIDPVRAPYEVRWRREAAVILADGGFRQDRVDEVSPPVEGWLVHDPTSVDARHAADIQRVHRMIEVPVRFGYHQEMRLLQQADLFTPMLLEMIAGEFDGAAFQRRLRAGRRRSAVFWIAFSAALLRHGKVRAAQRAIRRGRRLPHPEPAEFDLQEARVEAARGNHAAALRLATPWVDSASWDWVAKPLVGELQALVPPSRTGWLAGEPWRHWLRLPGGLRRRQ